METRKATQNTACAKVITSEKVSAKRYRKNDERSECMKALTLTAMLAVSTMCAGVAVNADLARDYLFAGKNELIEYRKEVREGETLWDICSEIATDKEDLRKLVWQAMRDNNITDPVELQPGTEIVIKVKAVM